MYAYASVDITDRKFRTVLLPVFCKERATDIYCGLFIASVIGNVSRSKVTTIVYFSKEKRKFKYSERKKNILCSIQKQS